MFWFSEAVLKKLCNLPLQLTAEERDDVSNSFANIYSTHFHLSFRQNEYVYLNNYELDYLVCVYSCAKNKTSILKLINKVLNCDNLYFDGNVIINKKGTCADVVLDKRGDALIVKKIAHDNDSDVKCVEDEYNLLIKLNKINKDCFVIAFEDGFINKSYYMEFGDESLESYIRKNKHISFQTRINIIVQLCKDVKALHDYGIAHCDIHQNNFLYFKSSERWKLIDFGYSKTLSNIAAHSASDNHNIKLDIIGIGCMINYIMTGNSKIIRHELSEIAKKCLETYRSVSEILIDISNLVQNDLSFYI